MTEQEYINVSELSIVSSLIKLIDGIVTENSKVIPSSGLADIKKELCRWQIKLFEIVNIEDK